MSYKIMTFESVHHALRAEKEIRQAGLQADAISVPRRLSSDCGIALRFAVNDEDEVRRTMEASCAPFKGIYNEVDQ